MRPLTSEDPRTIGAFRPLARLGAGGMGVVYLARSSGGALAAVKVIRAEHAADPRFRARFRREAEAARLVEGPWVVPVVDADTDSREPWLATAFVPGPSLAEVVADRGALPGITVRALGARLAGALAAVHRAGLVHRDVKPGNVLLALDGPRLIDFGIARHEGATALTATGVVIGTPGFLAPEQASAGESGPASDVFSLGCVLVYAATGRRPFGEGPPASVLFRTVHEEADLRGLPPGLRALTAACLAKDPAVRPSPEQMEEALTDEADADPGRWIPAGLPAVIAARATAALALPDPDPGADPGAEPGADPEPGRDLAPTPHPAAPGPHPVTAPPPPPDPTRRRLLGIGVTGALLAGGGTAAWFAVRKGNGKGGTPAGTGSLPTYTLGLHADLTGPGRAVGVAHRRGLQLAVADHNSRTDAGFRLALRTEDDAGDPARALRVADRLAGDTDVLAVVGPTTDVPPKALADRYEKARLAVVVVSSGAAGLAGTGTLCVIRPPDTTLVSGLMHYLVNVRPARRVHIIEDRDGGRIGWAMTALIQDVAPTAGFSVKVHPVGTADGFAPAARETVAGRADAVVYAGASPTRAARCATALTAAGFTGTRLSAGPVLAPAFLEGAARAAEGWVFAEAYTEPQELPAAKKFCAVHRTRFGVPPGRWSAESYDAAGLIARAAGTTSATAAERGGIAQRLFRLTYQGITRPLSFHPTDLVRAEQGIFLYRIEDGRARFLGPYAKA